MVNQSFSLLIRTRQDVVFDAEVESVSSTNATGNFDVLAGHAFFISLIEKFITIRQSGGRHKQFEVDEGIIYVEGDKVRIYLERPPREIT